MLPFFDLTAFDVTGRSRTKPIKYHNLNYRINSRISRSAYKSKSIYIDKEMTQNIDWITLLALFD